MTPMKRSLTALAAAAMFAGVGYATAQSAESMASEPPVQAQTEQMPTHPAVEPPADQAAQPQGTTMAADPAAPSPAAMPAEQGAQSQTTMTPADPSSAGAGLEPTTSTTTTRETSTEVVPPPPTGVTTLARPKGTVTATDKQPNGPLGVFNNVMTTGVTSGATRPSIGDHATPPIQAAPTTVEVTTERTTTTTTTPLPAPEPQAAPAPEPEAAAEPAPEPMPAPRADRN